MALGASDFERNVRVDCVLHGDNRYVSTLNSAKLRYSVSVQNAETVSSEVGYDSTLSTEKSGKNREKICFDKKTFSKKIYSRFLLDPSEICLTTSDKVGYLSTFNQLMLPKHNFYNSCCSCNVSSARGILRPCSSKFRP